MSFSIIGRTAGNSIGSFSQCLNSNWSSPSIDINELEPYKSLIKSSKPTKQGRKYSNSNITGLQPTPTNLGFRYKAKFSKSFKHFQIQNSYEEKTSVLSRKISPVNRYSVFCAAMVSLAVQNKINPNSDSILTNEKEDFTRELTIPKTVHIHPFNYKKTNVHNHARKRFRSSNNPSKLASSLKLSKTQPKPTQINDSENICSTLHTVGCGYSKSSGKDDRINFGINDTFSANFGEDAAFVASNKQNSSTVFGVCDGVGGWSKYGVDPKQFSYHLASKLKLLVNSDEKFQTNQPVQLLSKAYNSLFSKPDLIGSSTACLASFCRITKKLFTANLGDSGYLVIRKNKIISRSIPQTHGFNAPYQLSKIPNKIKHGCYADSPSQAAFGEFQCELGDVLLLASDGFFDNVFEKDLLRVLQPFELENCDVENDVLLSKSVQTLVEYTKMRANDRYYKSPFSEEAERHFGKPFMGGKKDDITVLLSVVGSN